jgi:hypothetical protein
MCWLFRPQLPSDHDTHPFSNLEIWTEAIQLFLWKGPRRSGKINSKVTISFPAMILSQAARGYLNVLRQEASIARSRNHACNRRIFTSRLPNLHHISQVNCVTDLSSLGHTLRVPVARVSQPHFTSLLHLKIAILCTRHSIQQSPHFPKYLLIRSLSPYTGIPKKCYLPSPTSITFGYVTIAVALGVSMKLLNSACSIHSLYPRTSSLQRSLLDRMDCRFLVSLAFRSFVNRPRTVIGREEGGIHTSTFPWEWLQTNTYDPPKKPKEQTEGWETSTELRLIYWLKANCAARNEFGHLR